MKNKFFLIVLIFFSPPVVAECDFKTGEFIDELKDPRSIVLIEVEVPKSAKYFRNVFKIIASESRNIPSNLKKSFRAEISVHYQFGVCTYQGKVRQSGDWRDHIRLLPGGKVLRSLDVKLRTGNIINAVGFKLLIPETRLGMNEILATLLLGKAGFIVPETFEVQTLVNGVKAKMLFQEKARKELLERNLRRESAILEGDEQLMWGYQDLDRYEPLSLSRLVNEDWFVKGASSQEISLAAFTKLQEAYLRYANSIDGKMNLAIFPNSRETDTFENYFFILFAMGGEHGLRPHNRKYYFNPTFAAFEPIYYDGMARFSKLPNPKTEPAYYAEAAKALDYPLDQKFLEKLATIYGDDTLTIEFLKRVKTERDTALEFLNTSLDIFFKNLELLAEFVEANRVNERDNSIENNLILRYEKYQNETCLKQKIISKFKFRDSRYEVSFRSGGRANLSVEDMADVISKNMLLGQRIVLIDMSRSSFSGLSKRLLLNDFPGEISFAPNIKVDLSIKKKSIVFKQTHPSDWALINAASLGGWDIEFIGLPASDGSKDVPRQRFNQFGLTGCLTILNSTFKDSIIKVNGGACEDGLNIVSSSGEISSIKVLNSFEDAVDIDFSSISVDDLNVINAGNDCFDVSGGQYAVQTAVLNSCGDKGLSVGEMSFLEASKLAIDNAKIGISSKDSSRVAILDASMRRVSTCSAVIQKKQEFGGAYLNIMSLDCAGRNIVDTNSQFFRAPNEF